MSKTKHYESDETTFAADAYRVKGSSGVAWYVLGWEIAPAAGPWHSDLERTGNVLAVMVGDDHKFSVDPSDLEPLNSAQYCATCGQIGCGHGSVSAPETVTTIFGKAVHKLFLKN